VTQVKQTDEGSDWRQRAVLHADMDAFYASVEILDDPSLAGQPVVVGGQPGKRGVVAAASYEARRYGIHSAMPMARAVRLCPNAYICRPRMARYAEISGRIREIMERYTPLVEPLALDEAFLDVTGSQNLFGPAPQLGRELKCAIASETGLTVSVGVAPNKFLAKIASDIDKPDGFAVVLPDGVEAFLDPLPVSRLWGVGPVTQKALQRHGITLIGHLRRLPPGAAEQLFGSHGAHLAALAQGLDHRPVVPESEAKSLSNETTFAEDLTDDYLLRAWIQQLAEQVSWRLRRADLRGNTIQIKVRFSDFTTITRAQKLAQSTDISREINHIAQQLFRNRLPVPRPPVRLLGVGIAGLGEEVARQGDLFDDPLRVRDSRVDEVVDTIRDRFGRSAAHRGAGIDPGTRKE